jgi:hypothetical protein
MRCLTTSEPRVICRERAEAAAELKAAHEEHTATLSPQDTEPGGPTQVAASLQQLLDGLPLSGGQQDDPEGDWRAVVIARLSRLVVESERQLSRAQAEGRMSHREATRLRGQVAALEGALERKSIEWEVAEGQLAGLRARHEQRQEEAAGWASARVVLLRQQVERLGGQLERAHHEVAAAWVELAGARKEGAAHKEHAERLARKLMLVQADQAAERGGQPQRGNTEAAEAGGARGPQEGGTTAGQGPDEETKAWFEEQVRLRRGIVSDVQPS